MNVQKAFSTSYAAARIQFQEAATAAQLVRSSYEHPLKGRDGETLALDVALDGPADAQKLLIVSSACHGVEGYCGSGIQVYMANHHAWRAKLRASGVAVLYLHALNPYGFSYARRTTHENVDLNRNFQNFKQPLPVNAAYGEIHPLLLPEQWPPTVENQNAVAAYIAQHGLDGFQSTVSGGQYAFADGLFYGGTEPTWSNLTLRHVLRTHGRRASHIAWIDLHTGLGPSGLGERIFAGKNDALALARARAWWGSNGATPVTSFYDGSSSSAVLTGLMWDAMYDECPQAQYTGIAMEYGTLPFLDVQTALRADQWLQLHPETAPKQRDAIKQQILDAFYVNTPTWRSQVIEQAEHAMLQAVDGLQSA